MARPARPEPKVFLSDEAADKGLEWYQQTFFAHMASERVLGEKSTSYLEDRRAPHRAARMLGAAEIMVLLRDPVQRAVSNWRFSTDNGLETRPLERALRENLTSAAAWDPAASSVSPFAYLERGRYSYYLDPWAETFAATMHVCFLRDLRSGSDTALREMYGGLGVDREFRPPQRGQVVNQSREPVSPLPADLLAQLGEYYADSDAALTRLLGRDLPWSNRDQRGSTHV